MPEQEDSVSEDLPSDTAAAAGETGRNDLDLAAIEKSLDLDIDQEPDAGACDCRRCRDGR